MAISDLRVLVVDDDPDAAELVALVVAGLGCMCRVANGHADALALAADFAPHLAILDEQLADGSGVELARCLRAATRHPLYLVAFTGSAVRIAGFDVHLVKPATPTTLRDTVARAVDVLAPRGD